ncbi:hypothetical protein LIX60_25345 [Streptomyces sp. S07_1.15]|uniref:hypothetical protein n=1 Tax=Streptomyces sp. S07_1.15 TaxID=2873925 RepID=UPI001D134455|nr:hypothetical protein [Streptomyces sp. S07_1.15]MCC3654729.1 hypothetical protein [Streptomyces sp. S07_1.15]
MTDPRTAALEARDRADAELHRLAVVEELHARSGLVYAALDEGGPYLVSWNGRLIGEVHQEGPGALRCWRPRPYGDDEQLQPGQREDVIPYPTIRAAAAALMPSQEGRPR